MTKIISKKQKSSTNFVKTLWFGLVLIALVAGVVSLSWHFAGARNGQSTVTAQSASSMSSLSDLLALPSGALEQVDIARMNLLCAQGLPGAEDLNVNDCLATLDKMVSRVREETERYHYRFERNPAEFENSEAFYKMVIMAVVLAEDFQVKYFGDKDATGGRWVGGTLGAGPGAGFAVIDWNYKLMFGPIKVKPKCLCEAAILEMP